MRTHLRALVFAASVLLAAPAWAGQACGESPLDPAVFRKAMNTANKTRIALDAMGLKVAVIARVGSDLSKHGLRYSHAAFAWKNNPKGRWFVTHLLNECGTAKSDLYDEGLGNFYLDDLFAFDTLIVIPSPQVQDELEKALLSRNPRRLYEPAYSMIANPFSTKHQNSNQWLLEVAASVLAPAGSIASRSEAQAWLRDQAYAPSEITITLGERLGARLFRANVSFDDHAMDSLKTNRFPIVSAESIAGFILAKDRGARQMVLEEN